MPCCVVNNAPNQKFPKAEGETQNGGSYRRFEHTTKRCWLDAMFRVSTAFFCVFRFGLIVWGFFVAEKVVAKGVSESVPDQRVI